MELVYTLSEAARTDLFLATGRIEQPQQIIACDPTELDLRDRQLLADLGILQAAGRLYLQYRDIQHEQVRLVNLVLDECLSDTLSGAWQVLKYYRDARSKAEARIREWQDDKIDKLIETYNGYENGYIAYSQGAFGDFAGHPRQPELEAAWDAAKARSAAFEAQQQAERQAQYAAQTAAAEAQRAETAAWIAAHGSDKLKRMAGQGYEIIKQYARERAALEHPGYTLDLCMECQWVESDDPSEYALTLATEAGGRVVMLQQPKGGVGGEEWDYDENTYADPVEAILIDNYLGVCPLFIVP